MAHSSSSPTSHPGPSPRDAVLAYLEWCRQRGIRHPVVQAAADVAPSGSATEELPIEAGGGLVLAPMPSLDRVAAADGSNGARVLFLGDVPTPEALAARLPFAGDERALLEKMIVAMALGPLGACLANVYPEAAATEPTPAELGAAGAVVATIVGATAPELVVVLGPRAAKAAFGGDASFERQHGQIMTSSAFGGLPTMATYHPRDLLQRPSDKRAAWADLQQAMQWLSQRPRSTTRNA